MIIFILFITHMALKFGTYKAGQLTKSFKNAFL